MSCPLQIWDASYVPDRTNKGRIMTIRSSSMETRQLRYEWPVYVFSLHGALHVANSSEKFIAALFSEKTLFQLNILQFPTIKAYLYT